MSCFILCPDCAENLGEVYDFINLAKNGLFKKHLENSKYKNFNPDKIALQPQILPNISEILDAVGLTHDCCRMHILGTTNSYFNYKTQ